METYFQCAQLSDVPYKYFELKVCEISVEDKAYN